MAYSVDTEISIPPLIPTILQHTQKKKSKGVILFVTVNPIRWFVYGTVRVITARADERK